MVLEGSACLLFPDPFLARRDQQAGKAQLICDEGRVEAGAAYHTL